ncbi:amidase family protein [Paraburkholderia aspalathi]|uniref:Acylamidase n=1 Tax=Paraburkholderia nemoris TaxID=2793076 RepID=A0ABN7M7Z5_9BURK|nr:MULTISPECIES: amidase family protein [Paraburkholderia]MBK3812891.1 amidase family protein [Paraburkholderia aspalathi]CAE6788257.1 Acylamidase [Paraburkholderia nemoris]
MQELWRLSATDLAQLVRTKEVSAREAATAALARLDAVNPMINAVVDHRPDDVLQQADAVDAAIARGEDPGVLAGVPVTIKVNIDQAGYASTNGLNLQRDLIATANSPIVENLRKAGAVILGRTNTPAFSYRWFTSNLIHGDTRNPRDPSITPGGSSGGAGAAVAAGIGHIAHGTDIAGSVRYPAYACGVHGLRPTIGRIAAFNPAQAQRTICPQMTAVSGPLARTIGDLRIALAAMSAPDPRDPWWVPAPLQGPPKSKRAALCLNPDGLDPVPEVQKALIDAGERLRRAGWTVDEIADTPPLREAADWQTKLWLGDGYEAQLAAAEKEGDPGALVCLHGNRARVVPFDQAMFSKALMRRATLSRQWSLFLEDYAVVLMPVSRELPFPDQLDRKDEASFARVWDAQLIQVAIPYLGLPGLTVTTGLIGRVPVGVQIVAGRYREDLCLAAGAAIEAGGVPPMPIDPAS